MNRFLGHSAIRKNCRMELPAVGCLCSDCRCCFVFVVTLLKILVKKIQLFMQRLPWQS